MGRRPKWMRVAGFPIVIISFAAIVIVFSSVFREQGNLGTIVAIIIATIITKLIGWGLYGYIDWFTMKSIEYEFRDAGEKLTVKECVQRKIDQTLKKYEEKQAKKSKSR